MPVAKILGCLIGCLIGLSGCASHGVRDDGGTVYVDDPRELLTYSPEVLDINSPYLLADEENRILRHQFPSSWEYLQVELGLLEITPRYIVDQINERLDQGMTDPYELTRMLFMLALEYKRRGEFAKAFAVYHEALGGPLFDEPPSWGFRFIVYQKMEEISLKIPVSDTAMNARDNLIAMTDPLGWANFLKGAPEYRQNLIRRQICDHERMLENAANLLPDEIEYHRMWRDRLLTELGIKPSDNATQNKDEFCVAPMGIFFPYRNVEYKGDFSSWVPIE